MTRQHATQWILAAAAMSVFALSPLVAQSSHNGTIEKDVVTTKSGVFTAEQAMRGKDIYAGNCRSCHTAETHTGAAFTSKWNKRPLSDLYVYIRDQMPKSAPGSLEAQEYADVLAYVLRMNRMPAGQVELPPDSAAISRIRINVAK